MNSVLTVASGVLLADDPTKGPEFGKASPIGLLAVIVLLIATFLLIRSMNKQLKKLPESFDTEHPEPDQAFDEGTDSVDDDVTDADGSAAGDGSTETRSAELADRADERGTSR